MKLETLHQRESQLFNE